MALAYLCMARGRPTTNSTTLLPSLYDEFQAHTPSGAERGIKNLCPPQRIPRFSPNGRGLSQMLFQHFRPKAMNKRCINHPGRLSQKHLGQQGFKK